MGISISLAAVVEHWPFFVVSILVVISWRAIVYYREKENQGKSFLVYIISGLHYFLYNHFILSILIILSIITFIFTFTIIQQIGGIQTSEDLNEVIKSVIISMVVISLILFVLLYSEIELILEGNKGASVESGITISLLPPSSNNKLWYAGIMLGVAGMISHGLAFIFVGGVNFLFNWFACVLGIISVTIILIGLYLVSRYKLKMNEPLSKQDEQIVRIEKNY